MTNAAETADARFHDASFHDAVERATRDLVRVRRHGAAIDVTLPMVYADGSYVTVCIAPAQGRLFRVGDCGFAYRECEDLAGTRAFRRVAGRVAEARGVDVGERVLSVTCPEEMLERAIWDVAETSWRVVDHVASRAMDDEEDDMSDALTHRLRAIFGDGRVAIGADLPGSSTTSWRLSALVTGEGGKTAFQAVAENPNSVNKASTAFRDIGSLERPPRLVAVVRSKEALGSRLGLLHPARVIETGQADEAFRRAAA